MGDVLDKYNLNLPKKQAAIASAGFFRRSAAFIVDLFVLDLFILFPFTSVLGDRVLDPYVQPGLLLFFLTIVGIIALLYFSLFQLFMGQTIGMKLFGITTIVFTFQQAVLRNIFIIPTFPFILLWVVEFVHLLIFKERFLEKITGTKTFQIIEL